MSNSTQEIRTNVEGISFLNVVKDWGRIVLFVGVLIASVSISIQLSEGATFLGYGLNWVIAVFAGVPATIAALFAGVILMKK